MDKILNLIIYIPGHAGHFIANLLSLDNSTFLPYDNLNSIDRLEKLSFNNLYWKYGSWKKFHNENDFFIQEGIKKFIEQNSKKVFTIHFHPSHKEKTFEMCKEYLPLISKFNYLLVHLDGELEYVIDEFKKANNNFPILGQKDYFYYDKIKKENNPYIIELKNFFYGKETFVHEYKKLVNHLQLPENIDIALDLYKGWYTSRNLRKYNFKIGGPTRIRT